MARSTIKKLTTLSIVFGCGGLFFVNLGELTPAGNGYQGSWINVILSVVLAAWHSRYVAPTP
jgi:hypothetical protein